LEAEDVQVIANRKGGSSRTTVIDADGKAHAVTTRKLTEAYLKVAEEK
jgi:hypothetical protein